MAEVKLKSGMKINIKDDVILDERDELLDGIEWTTNDKGDIQGVKAMNSTMTKWFRICLESGTSDKELIKWSMEDRTDAFMKLQKRFLQGEEKASK